MLGVRRFTLITVVVLAILLLAAALLQLLLPEGDERYPGGPLTPTVTPVG